MTDILTVPYEATLPSFGSPAARKHVRKRDFVLQGNNGAWVTIASDQYELDEKNGTVRQRSEDASANDVDWEAYSSYRWSGTIVAGGARTTITNEAVTFADADYAEVEAGPDDQIQDELASDSILDDDDFSDENQSDNYVAGVSGYFIDRVTGNAEFNNITARGTIIATAGTIGGWTIGASTISNGSISLDSSVPKITVGSATGYLTGAGIFMGLAGGAYKFHIGNPSGNYLSWDGTNLAASGQWITGAGMNPSLQTWKTNITFSSASATQVNWTSGTIRLNDGTTYSISSGSTGTMSALTYVYLDTAVSTTVLQTTTTYSTAIGSGKILIATAQNDTVAASVIPFGGQQPLISGAQINALSILAGNIAAGAITATKINVSTLSAIAADMGTVTAGTIIGATIKTAASNPSIQLDTTALTLSADLGIYQNWKTGSATIGELWAGAASGYGTMALLGRGKDATDHVGVAKLLAYKYDNSQNSHLEVYSYGSLAFTGIDGILTQVKTTYNRDFAGGTTVQNTTTETTIYSAVIKANAMGTQGVLTIELGGDLQNDSGGAIDLTFRVKFGGTILTFVVNVPDFTGTGGYFLRARIGNDGHTNVQRGFGTLIAAKSGVWDRASADYGTSNADTTIDRTLTITAK